MDGTTRLHDRERLEVLRRSQLLDTPAEERFDRLTRLASRLLNAPVALVSLVDDHRQFFKSQCGLPEPWATERETPLSHSFCQHVVVREEELIVEDAREHPLVRENLAIRDLGVIAYAGVPITTRSGHILGSFCAIDGTPRRWTAEEVQTLRDLAGVVSTEVELRLSAQQLVETTEAALGHRDRQLREAQQLAQLGSWEWEPSTGRVLASDELYRIFGLDPAAELTLEQYEERLHPADRERVLAAMRNAVETGEPYAFEHRIVRPDGAVRWVFGRGEGVRDAAGRRVGLFGTTQDVTDRKESQERALQLLREQVAREQSEAARRRITAILESITEAFFALDGEWRFTYLNEEAERLLRRGRDELLGRSIWEGFPEAVGSTFYEHYRRAVEERRTVQFEELYPPLQAWYEVRAFPSEEGLSVYFHDITERRRMEEAIRESESRFRIMFRDSPLPMWVFDLETRRFLDVNETAVRQYGYSREEFLAMTIQDIRPPDAVAELDRVFTPDQRGIVHQGLFHHRRKDGSLIDVEVTTQEITLGERAARVAVVLDVTDRRVAEQEREQLIRALDAERGRLQSIFTQAPAAIALYRGPEHVITTVNPLWEEVVGRRDVLGKRFRDVFPELEGTGLFEVLDRVYETGEPFVGNETRVLLNRGGRLEETFWNFVWQPLTDAEGRISDVFLHAVEVTDQVRVRQVVEQKADELARLARALEASNLELDQFAYVASHDLKAPLRGIANLSTWIEEDLGPGALTEETREHLELLRGRVHRMEGLIDGILQYSRAGKVRESPEPVDTAALTREIVDLLAPPENVVVEVGEMPAVTTERLPLQQVLLNLIGNAIKYTERPDARVEVGARDEGAFWEFSVRDNGPGIPPEYQDRVFGIFQRLEARDTVEGTGIGLSIVKKMVESRGGRVWVESEVGQGATFRFLWPKDAPPRG